MGNYTLYNATRPSNADPQSTPDCAEWYTVVAGDGCASIETEFGLTSSQFLQLNPGVGSDCTTLQIGVRSDWYRDVKRCLAHNACSQLLCLINIPALGVHRPPR